MYRNVRVIPKQLLEQLYVEKQWSIRDVAEYFQCSVDTIMRRMKEYEIDRRPLKKDINMVHVQALYESGKWSLHSLAKRYDVSITTMASRMKEYGLACQRSSKNIAIDPVRICRAYKSGNTSDSIARMYGISRRKVHHVLRHMGMCTTLKAKTSRKVDEMSYLYINHHMSTDDLGLAYGIRGSTVAMYLREQGIEIRSNTLELDENRIKNLRAQGYGVAKIAQMMGCSTSAVRKRLAMKKYISP